MSQLNSAQSVDIFGVGYTSGSLKEHSQQQSGRMCPMMLSSWHLCHTIEWFLMVWWDQDGLVCILDPRCQWSAAAHMHASHQTYSMFSMIMLVFFNVMFCSKIERGISLWMFFNCHSSLLPWLNIVPLVNLAKLSLLITNSWWRVNCNVYPAVPVWSLTKNCDYFIMMPCLGQEKLNQPKHAKNG